MEGIDEQQLYDLLLKLKDEQTPLTKPKPNAPKIDINTEQQPATVEPEKEKKPRKKITVPKSQAQMESFKMAQDARKQSIAQKKQQKLLETARLLLQQQQQQPVNTPPAPQVDMQQPVSPPPTPNIQQQPKQKVKKSRRKKIIIESSSDESSSDESEIEVHYSKPKSHSKAQVIREQPSAPKVDMQQQQQKPRFNPDDYFA